MADTRQSTSAGLIEALVTDCTASRLWDRDTSLFPEQDAEAITDRFGWLDAVTDAPARIAAAEQFADTIHLDELTDVYILGMGGSSLGAEVLRDVPGPRRAACRLVTLDTTDERAVRHISESLEPRRSLFLVASKSGATAEMVALERYFWHVMSTAVDTPGRHFAAITDPDTALVTLAEAQRYRQTFVNPADIGGRYSVLSWFGLVPAALAGIDLVQLTESAVRMADACRPNTPDNPGLELGAFMAAHAASGRDKLTLLLPQSLTALGAWVEQLVAESTGKCGRGVLPIVGEPLGEAAEYGADRAFVVVLTRGTGDLDATARTLESAGHPVLRLSVEDDGLGAEFFRWEFGTAIAAVALGVNPFDEPNVRDAKDRTRAQLETRARVGDFRIDPPFERKRGYGRREHRPFVTASDSGPAPGRYLALLDYLPTDVRRPIVIERLRGAIRARTRAATTYGVGPRYLHSTGQYHKGGPNTGMFVLLTAADASVTPVPNTDYTFSALKEAQALADFDALVAAGRDVVHYHVDDPASDFSETLERILGHL